MGKLLFAIALCLSLLSGCKSPQDQTVAEILNKKLYRSEVAAALPKGLNPEDSLLMANQMIEEWIKKQLLLHEANNTLSVAEKSFEKELESYKNDLLLHAFFQELTRDSAGFTASEEELRAFLARYHGESGEEKTIVKLNYAKLSPKSKVLKPLRDILFDENRRMFEKERMEELCADSIEYFIEDHTWLYLDDIEHELPITEKDIEVFTLQNRHIERKAGNYLYLIVFIEKGEVPVRENLENLEAARKMIVQEKKSRYVDHYIDSLYQKALHENMIVR